MKNIEILLLTLIIGLCGAHAQNYHEYLETAEKHFNSGNYEKAVVAYNVYKKLTGKTITKYEKISLSKLDNIQSQYNQLVSKATGCFNKKRFIEARKYYEEAVLPEYHEFYNKGDFEWLSLCDSILVAQNQNEAITPQLAIAFKNISSMVAEPTGFSDGVMVIKQGYGHLTLITTEGDKKELADAFVSLPTLFTENRLSVNLNNSSCFIDKDGVIVLNWRKSNYNNLFNIKDYKFSNFENGCAYVTGRNGCGLIDKYGCTMLLPQKKYTPYILKDRIILYDGTNIFCYYRRKLENGDQITKYMHKLFRCKGMIWDVTEDYIIIRDIKNDKYIIYTFDSGKIYTTTNWIRAISSNLVLLRDNNDNNNFLWDFEKGIKIELGRQWYGKNGNNFVFEYGQPIIIGSKCYDINGKLLFSFTEDIKVASVGFTDGYLLIRKPNNKYCYIDKMGKILADYEFEIPKSAEHLIQYHFRKPFGNGFGLIVKDGKWGLIDRFGTTTFDYQD